MENSAGFHPLPGAVPLHVGIIPDGGRRWARVRGCSLGEAYQKSSSFLFDMVALLSWKGVKEISIYLSSIQNFRRDPSDIKASLDLIESALNSDIAAITTKLSLKLVVAGNFAVLPPSLVAAIHSSANQTKNNTRGRLNLLLAYDPFEELNHAIRSSPDPSEVYRHLWITTPLDLVIRTGGAALLSNFLPLQSAWARLYFTDTLFNDMTADDVLQILGDFSKIQRKFGD
ncbi:MAG: polyprenyl diphosphate synthase [Bacteroidota bacterium]